MEDHVDRMNIASSIRAIDSELPQLARKTIAAHLDLSQPLNQAFFDAPDGREQHQVHWHQWGIITHTRVFLAALDGEVPDLLKSWELWQPVWELLDRPLDGESRWDLLHVAVLLHDIGKFGARTHTSTGFHFPSHEKLSGSIVRDEIDLAQYGFSAAQCTYIAQNAADHFVLGLVRRRARDQGEYGAEYVQSEDFTRLCDDIKSQHPDNFCEVGVLFLGDSLAKIDPDHGPDRALSQHEINLAVARRYLELTLTGGSI